MSTNRNYQWWKHVANANEYFTTKYITTINSSVPNQQKVRNKKNKQKSNSKNKTTFMTLKHLINFQKYGNNIFFTQKTDVGEGPIIFKGYLPRMTRVPLEVLLLQQPVLFIGANLY